MKWQSVSESKDRKVKNYLRWKAEEKIENKWTASQRPVRQYQVDKYICNGKLERREYT